MKNRGKIFEDSFKKSVPSNILYERFHDTGYAYGVARDNNQGFNTMYTAKNVCDCFLFDGSVLIYVELKSHKGKSLPLNCIRDNQIKELSERQAYHANVIAGILVQFEDLERVFWLNIADLCDFIRKEERKSIPFDYFRDTGIEVEIKKLRTNYRYNVSKMVEDIVNKEL